MSGRRTLPLEENVNSRVCERRKKEDCMAEVRGGSSLCIGSAFPVEQCSTLRPSWTCWGRASLWGSLESTGAAVLLEQEDYRGRIIRANSEEGVVESILRSL